MNHKDFNKHVEDQLLIIRDTLIKKGEEYNQDADRLEFFKKSAALLDGTPEQALYGFLLKHIVSITEMVTSGKEFPYALYEEKCGDIINYMILLLAIEKEKSIKTGGANNE